MASNRPSKSNPVLITGVAGFIGFHLARRLLENGRSVVGVDNLNEYYDVSLKTTRLSLLKKYENFVFARIDIADADGLGDLFASHQPEEVVNLAAQAGVRYSITHPRAYADSNIVGFLNLLQLAKEHKLRHLVYASSSSVYGANVKVPFSEDDNTDRPINFYAVTKKANELMAYSFGHLYGLPCTGLRFFTAYGPWGRPDMAYFKFTRAILAGESIDLYNNGEMKRDFTYIDDIIEGVVRILARPPCTINKNDTTGDCTHRLFNIGNHTPVKLLDFIASLEFALGRKARLNLLAMQPGEVITTYADTSRLEREVDFSPATPLSKGIQNFVEWYCSYYRQNPKLI